jgi:hypothetical protein
VKQRKPDEASEAGRLLGKLGGKARMDALSHQERYELSAKGADARAKKLSAAQRSRIAKKAVQARERKRAERRADHE